SGHVGVTALGGMAFLAGGHLPGRGEYGEVVQRATDALLASVQDSGLITASGTRMYSHAFATLFLAEVYGMSADPEIREGLEKATHIIIDIQNSHGAWRYNAFSRDSDLSVTVCQLQALRAARNIGIRVPRATIDRAVEYVRACQVPAGRAKGLYYYSIHGRRAYRKTDHYSIQAAAVTSLLSAGIYERELIEPVLDFLIEEMPYITDHYPHHYYFWYGNYYACQVFFHADGLLQEGVFDRYYRHIRQHLLRDQQADGRWLNPMSEGPGDAFGTAVACILLQVPKQYLPIFQR
ncbi:MAG: prenyltransferase/squalene oxidase repeat-containing protein, partial [Planctomycetota bacterium]